MKRFRLSAAERPQVKAITDSLALTLAEHLSADTVYATADLFVVIAAAAREADLVTDQQLATLRQEISAQLTPYRFVKYTAGEREVMRALNTHTEPVTASLLAKKHLLSPQFVGAMLKQLRDKDAVEMTLQARTGLYRLTDNARAEMQAST